MLVCMRLEEYNEFFKGLGAVEYGDYKPEVGMWLVTKPWLFRHYFLANGLEIGYVTMQLLDMEGYKPHVLTSPRYWHPPYKANLERGWLS